MAWRVAPDGGVADAHAIVTTLDAGATACLVRQVASLRFPASELGVTVGSYPMIFPVETP
jgi:hypothetical protein